jgi:hypothetical protein
MEKSDRRCQSDTFEALNSANDKNSEFDFGLAGCLILIHFYFQDNLYSCGTLNHSEARFFLDNSPGGSNNERVRIE